MHHEESCYGPDGGVAVMFNRYSIVVLISTCQFNSTVIMLMAIHLTLQVDIESP